MRIAGGQEKEKEESRQGEARQGCPKVILGNPSSLARERREAQEKVRKKKKN